MFTLSKDLGLLELVQLEVDFGYTFLIPCTVALVICLKRDWRRWTRSSGAGVSMVRGKTALWAILWTATITCGIEADRQLWKWKEKSGQRSQRSFLVSHIVDNTVYLSAENQAKAVKTAFSTKWEAKWSILNPSGYLWGPQSGPKSLMFIHSFPMRCFGVIWSFSVHHMGSFVISSSRTLYFGTSEVVTLNT